MASSTELEARAAADPHRPGFHFVSPAGWLNDPNGLAQRGGEYHLFYQYNPEAPVHHRIQWGHAVSTDLVTWRDLPIALEPSAGPDEDGCWSGVLVTDDDGVSHLVYSGRQGDRELPCLATGSADLVTWTKDAANPVIAAPPAGLDIVAFRDHCVWREDDRWRQIIGSGIRGVGGTALLYESDDLRSWTYVGELLTGDAADGALGDLDWTGTMWECVDLFGVPGGADALVFSAWDEGRTLHPLYWSGRYAGDRFEPEGLHRLDLGGRFFYAPQSFRDESGRRIMFGWMQEARPDAAVLQAGWSGVMSLPRVVTAGPGGTLHQAPAPEVDALRRELLYDGAADGLAGVAGDQLDLEFDLSVPDGGSVEVAVRASADGAERTVYRLSRTGDAVHFALDRSASSRDAAVDAAALAGEVPAGDGIRLRVLVDHSALEAFANGVPLSGRVYPTRPDSLGVEVACAGGAAGSVRAWRMATVTR
ncbi:glycoside hydrolase family 32 protein [Microbacterium aureliae]